MLCWECSECCCCSCGDFEWKGLFDSEGQRNIKRVREGTVDNERQHRTSGLISSVSDWTDM